MVMGIAHSPTALLSCRGACVEALQIAKFHCGYATQPHINGLGRIDPSVSVASLALGDGVDYKALGPKLEPGLRSVAACRSCTVDEGKLIFSVVRSPTGCELCCLRMPVSRKLPSSSFLLLRLPVTADISPFWNGAPTIDMGRRIIPVCTPHLYWCSTYPSLAR